MSQDADIARLAEALKVPGLPYRSFNNEFVRTIKPPAAKRAVSITIIKGGVEADTENCRSPAVAAPVMTLTADTVSGNAAPARCGANESVPSAAPEWPLLEPLTSPTEALGTEEAGGTFVRLLDSKRALAASPEPVPLSPALTARLRDPGVQSVLPQTSLGLFPFAWSPLPKVGPQEGGASARPASASPQSISPFPAHCLPRTIAQPQASGAPTAQVPAEHVAIPLAEVFQTLGRNVGAVPLAEVFQTLGRNLGTAPSSFAALRLPDGTPGP
jgi:hypothetical protein